MTAGGALLAAAVLLLALDLRAPIVSVAAGLAQVRGDLALSGSGPRPAG